MRQKFRRISRSEVRVVQPRPKKKKKESDYSVLRAKADGLTAATERAETQRTCDFLNYFVVYYSSL